jgi:hypothetical protein
LTNTIFQRDLGYWELPKPVKGQEKVWHPIVRVAARRVPFGYEVDPDNEKLLRAIPHELEALLLAKKHLKQYSYREVANWLITQTGRSITHSGLRRRIEIERRRKKASAIKRQLAKRLQETLAEIEKLEKGVTGYYTVED